MDADGSNPRRLTDNPARDESPDWQALPFDGRGHRACGDDSLASGGASSVLAMRVPCHVARRIARRWSAGRRRGRPARQAPRPDVHHDAAALRPDGRATAARTRRRARATSRSCGATRRGRPRRRRPPQALAAPEAGAPPAGRPGRRGLRRGARGVARAGTGTRGAAIRGRAALRRCVSSAARLVGSVGVLGEVVLGERREAGADLLLGRLAASGRCRPAARRRRRSRPASGR